MTDSLAANAVESATRAVPTDIASLYQTYYVGLARLALQLLADPDAAEDVVQDVFAALHRRGSTLTLDDPRRYLVTAVVNRSRSALRRRQVAQALQLDRPPPAEAADAATLRAAERSRVLAVLDRLPRRQREVLVLRYYQDLSVTEVAAVLGISYSAVSTSASRGLQKMADYLGRNR